MLQSARHQDYISEQAFFSVHQDLRLQGTWHSILSCQSSAGQIPGKRTLLKVDEQPLKIMQQKKRVGKETRDIMMAKYCSVTFQQI